MLSREPDKEQLVLLNYSVGSRIFQKVNMHFKILHLSSDHRTHLSRNAIGKKNLVNLLAPELCCAHLMAFSSCRTILHFYFQ